MSYKMYHVWQDIFLSLWTKLVQSLISSHRLTWIVILSMLLNYLALDLHSLLFCGHKHSCWLKGYPLSLFMHKFTSFEGPKLWSLCSFLPTFPCSSYFEVGLCIGVWCRWFVKEKLLPRLVWVRKTPDLPKHKRNKQCWNWHSFIQSALPTNYLFRNHNHPIEFF